MPLLSPQEVAHAQSITDPDPVLVPIPAAAGKRVLLASVIRKPPAVLAPWLESLTWQITRTPVALSYLFLPNFGTEPHAKDAQTILHQWAAQQERAKIARNIPAENDYGQTDKTRHWTPNAWHRVGALKNEILQNALNEGYDAVWLLDADVFCDRYTLQSMMDANAPIVSAVYWTFWTKQQPGAAERQHCGPQVWMRHPYEMNGNGYTAEQFRKALIKRERLQVGGLGACTLIHRSALEKGVSFSKVGEFEATGLMDGEDRHFCIRAARLHIPLVADAWPDIYHAYHPTDYHEIPQWLEKLNVQHPASATLGNLVSFTVEPLEMGAPVQYVRGRLGTLDLLPELEELLYGLPVGQSAIIKLHYPITAPQPFAGTSRIVRVTLNDAKPNGIAPTIERELLVGGKSGAFIDPVFRTGKQIEQIMAQAQEAA